jgi:hypothetical protein
MTQLQGQLIGRVCRGARSNLPIGVLAAVLALWAAGCADRVKLRPIFDEGEQQPIEKDRAALIEKQDLRLTLRQAKRVDLAGEEVAAVEIELFNGGDVPMTILLDDIVLIDSRGARYRPIQPDQLERTLELSGVFDPVYPPTCVHPCGRDLRHGWRFGRYDVHWGWAYCGYSGYGYYPDDYYERRAERRQAAGLVVALWREPVVQPGYGEAGVVVFRYTLEKRRVIRFELCATRLAEPPGQPSGEQTQPICFEFIFYTK